MVWQITMLLLGASASHEEDRSGQSNKLSKDAYAVTDVQQSFNSSDLPGPNETENLSKKFNEIDLKANYSCELHEFVLANNVTVCCAYTDDEYGFAGHIYVDVGDLVNCAKEYFLTRLMEHLVCDQRESDYEEGLYARRISGAVNGIAV